MGTVKRSFIMLTQYFLIVLNFMKKSVDIVRKKR